MTGSPPRDCASPSAPEGISVRAWSVIGARRINDAWEIPEHDGSTGEIIGWSRRFDNGKKRSRSGSRRGLMLAWPLDRYSGTSVDEPVVVVEGATCVGAGVTIGLAAVGRPSACGGVDHLRALLRDRYVCIVGENDVAGRKGAMRIASALESVCKGVRVIFPPAAHKDLRSWVNDGATRDDVLAAWCEGRDVLKEDNDDTASSEHPGEQSAPRPSQSTLLLQLASAAELWHCGDDAYATVPVGDHFEHWPVRSRRLRTWLSHEYFKAHRCACGSQALADAILSIEGRARFDGSERTAHVRVAEHQGAIYLDLCDMDWRVVKITGTGWSVLPNDAVPVRFRRAKAMLTLPDPEPDGTLDDLKQFLNVSSDADFSLVVGWLFGALRPDRPTPVLCINGEQGSAKSTTSRVCRSLVDPNAAPLRCEPREPRDLAIAANNSRVIALDNLSNLPPWLSDALCRLSTGGGFATRMLYENDEEAIFNALRPVLVNGIEEVATRSDLLDRLLRITLPPIPEQKRRTESDMWRDFEAARPKLLGALLSAVSTALRRIDEVRLPSAPRMADFAAWGVAAELSLPWRAGAFMEAYTDNRSEAHELAIETSIVGSATRAFAAQVREWSGTASELLKELNQRRDDNDAPKGWPSKPHVLSGALRRIAPNLRQVGVHIEFDQRVGRQRTRTITIRTLPESSGPSGPSVRTDSSAVQINGASGRSADDQGRSAELERPRETPVSTPRTHADAADAQFTSRSAGPGVTAAPRQGGFPVSDDSAPGWDDQDRETVR